MVLDNSSPIANSSIDTISVIIRTLNEINFLPCLIQSIRDQEIENALVKVVIVDSGSTDGTLEYARLKADRVVTIEKSKFTFGRSINLGISSVISKYTVLISGHCIPVDKFWLENLLQPMRDNGASAAYGRQIAPNSGRYSESRIFNVQYPISDTFPDLDPKFNNANSAFKSDLGAEFKFNEDLPGLEDLDFAFRLIESGHTIAYVSSAQVVHHHSESWQRIQKRFERESRALSLIRPLANPSLYAIFRGFYLSCSRDLRSLNCKGLLREFKSILFYRSAQFIGIFRGANKTSEMTTSELDGYFFS